MFCSCCIILYLCNVIKTKTFSLQKLSIMTNSNNTQKLFTTGQLIGIICFVAVAAVVVYMVASGDWSGMESVGLGK